MDCREVRALLHPFADGELEPEVEAEVRAELAGCPDCQGELEEIRAASALAREAFEAPVEGVDFGGFFDQVMARVEAQAAAEAADIAGVPVSVEGIPVMREEAQPGLLARLGSWLTALVRFERPLVSLAGLAAVVVLVGGMWMLQSGGDGVPMGSGQGPTIRGDGGGSVAQNDDPRGKRRGPETEGRGVNAATVEEVEVAIGRVQIEENTDDPERPMVVWHIVDEGATSAPERGL